MKLKSIILPVFLLLAAVCSCMKQQTENYYAKQEEAIDKFAQRLSPIRTVYNDGSVRIVVKETNPTADSLRKDGVVSFYYGGYLLSSSGSLNNQSLFATNSKELAESAKWVLSDSTVFRVETLKLDESNLLDGLKKGLHGVRSGEECYIAFTGKYGFGSKPSGTIPAKSTLVYHIWVDSISND
ncbi:MAG: FKBP-type peptidyl-prolyl cis-trans isomerase [Bacteroidales bacterium]|nr:FKBP-type peptidyl-prolyl cis-trans isomerase [Bacteroidales bacterium]